MFSRLCSRLTKNSRPTKINLHQVYNDKGSFNIGAPFSLKGMSAEGNGPRRATRLPDAADRNDTMPILEIEQKHSRLMPALPHKVLVGGRYVGIMQKDRGAIVIPEGVHQVTIQSMLPFISASADVQVFANQRNHLTFKDRERGWDLLFWIDVALSIAKWFFKLPSPFGLIYEIFTNGYFAVWLIYEWVIRKKYFRFEYTHQPLAAQ